MTGPNYLRANRLIELAQIEAAMIAARAKRNQEGMRAYMRSGACQRVASLPVEYREAVEAIERSRFHPLGDRYLVLPLPPADRFGVLHLPIKNDGLIGPTTIADNESTGLVRGLVLAVGPGAWKPGRKVFCRPSLGVAEVVVFDRFRGTDVIVAGVSAKVMAECDIQAVVE
jgi:co-chaperonin GroES (HSP10)